jgi:hypothetical protein
MQFLTRGEAKYMLQPAEDVEGVLLAWSIDWKIPDDYLHGEFIPHTTYDH